MKTLKNICRLASAAVLATGMLTLALPTQATNRVKPIVIPLVSDTSSDVLAQILGSTLAKAGYRTKYVVADYTASFSGIQTGDLHYTICWQSTWDLCIGSTESNKAVNAGSTGIASAEGWWYPMSLKKHCPGLPDWKALKQPACIKALSTAETAPKARFVEGPADWIMPVKEMATAFDLDFLPIASGSSAALVATISSAARRNEPVIGWGYTPHWYFMSDAGEFVQFPEYEDGCHSDPAWGTNPNATHDCGVQTGSLWVFANKQLMDEEPEAQAIINAFNIKSSQVADVFKRIDVDGATIEAAVAEWMDSNKAVWSKWIN